MHPEPAVEQVGAAAARLGRHPQDHGWRELFRLLAHGLAGDAPQLHDVVATALAQRPSGSPTHLATLLAIAVRSLAGASFPYLVGDRPRPHRLAALEELLRRHRRRVDHVLARRQNSFTGPRRFLVPQVLLAAYFARQPQPATFADLGTGLGVLPRQLNCRPLFDRYAPDLAWPGGRQPAYRPIPLAARYGVDRGPFPDRAWVRSCYGPSTYYAIQYAELVDTLALPEIRAAEVGYHELDLTDPPALRRFLAGRRVNAVNLSYVLYQLDPADRARVLGTVADSLEPPGLMIVTEPTAALARPGCTVTVQDHTGPAPRPLCTVSDGHFTGAVRPLECYREFVARYPIRFEPAATGVA